MRVGRGPAARSGQAGGQGQSIPNDGDPPGTVAGFHPGERVRVRSREEILATLDPDGRLDGLPFMPEMLRYCGETLRVFKRADHTCDSIFSPGQRRMESAVFLWGSRCDGSTHGSCQAGCLLFWKERWLAPADADGDRPGPSTASRTASLPRSPVGCTEADLVRATTAAADLSGATFACQATAIKDATTPLPRRPWWDVLQYRGDVRSGNVSMARVARFLLHELRIASRRPMVAARVRLTSMMRPGRPTRVGEPEVRDARPSDELGLQPGERVRVRSKKEIEATLDAHGRSRGLSFNEEMARYCGSEFSVLRRVERIINEESGRMMTLRDCIILDAVTCQGDWHAFCPRDTYVYWREMWLERASGDQETVKRRRFV